MQHENADAVARDEVKLGAEEGEKGECDPDEGDVVNCGAEEENLAVESEDGWRIALVPPADHAHERLAPGVALSVSHGVKHSPDLEGCASARNQVSPASITKSLARELILLATRWVFLERGIPSYGSQYLLCCPGFADVA